MMMMLSHDDAGRHELWTPHASGRMVPVVPGTVRIHCDSACSDADGRPQHNQHHNNAHTHTHTEFAPALNVE